MLVIGGCGAWCAHQHWMRLDKERSAWRKSFWSWAARGYGFPLFIWSLANFGFGRRFPPLTPLLADAQSSHQPWFASWLAVCLAGSILILTYWGAVTYLWILAVMVRQARDKKDFLLNIALFGAFSAQGGIRVTKAVLNSLGLAGGYPRRPRMPIGDEQRQRALAAVEELRLADIEGW